jgi:hypothetical protein
MGRWTERNRWRRGQWLVRDDESGFVHYADQVVRRWDGPIEPQWFITAESDPTNVPFVRPDQPAGPACKTGPAYDAANRPIKSFPGYNLYVGSSIGSMEIECSFIVFPDSGPYPPR